MAKIVTHDSFRILKACRSIEEANVGIISQVERMHADASRVKGRLGEAESALRDVVEQFRKAQDRLRDSYQNHLQTMKLVDEVMKASPVFAELRNSGK
ncbi:hypothetical protein HEQ62_02050 [Haematospirillum jordaniae]|uniref:Uncharacterized protein n=1 Tax=Haematospirillum jordaniae TaxID=1549855 RepID=A0A143DED2_9PROT|nr:hypothetical protein [Haematospirillum jordaniae]AMW35111.1 hypothetical protein AY555_07915 [Haematospirillum jordaniae]NKD44130.1 hypothetical protein [Haematospirillum jordaniae]NKD56508.1 hypothetical protein [Haematospirillum jordaniae]NKD58566.1 hypothetical protein [Haematospirillum jordaniae]NKD66265.1 hypothetical protein [Haematospirillum jordaniae]